jgi:hypothetical protein
MIFRWVERLRIVGIQRQGNVDSSALGDLPPSIASGSSTSDYSLTDLPLTAPPKDGIRKRIGVVHDNDAEGEDSFRRAHSKQNSERELADDNKSDKSSKTMDVDS